MLSGSGDISGESWREYIFKDHNGKEVCVHIDHPKTVHYDDGDYHKVFCDDDQVYTVPKPGLFGCYILAEKK